MPRTRRLAHRQIICLLNFNDHIVARMDWDSAIQLTIPSIRANDSKAWATGARIAMRCMLLDAANQKLHCSRLLPYVLRPMYNRLFNDSNQSGLSLKIPLHVAWLSRTFQKWSSTESCQPDDHKQTSKFQWFIPNWVWSECQVVLDSWLWGRCSPPGPDIDQCDLCLWTNCLSDVWQLVSQANAPLCK